MADNATADSVVQANGTAANGATADNSVAKDGKAVASGGAKNEFAERLAQSAMARAAKAKSSLLCGLPPAPATDAVVAKDIAALDESVNGPFVKPAHPFGRPRLVLQPRSAPLAADTTTSPGTQSAADSAPTSESDADKPNRPRLQLQPRTLPVATDALMRKESTESGRPKLNLLPRSSKPASEGADAAPAAGTGSDAPAAASTGARKASVFGAAKPREEVLKHRGVDIISEGSVGDRLSEASLARHGSSRPISRGTSLASDDDAWHTVGGRRHQKTALDAAFGTNGSVLDNDPFFGASSKPASAASRMYNNYSNGNGYGSYGSPAGGYFGGGGYGADDERADDDERGFFRRALPTRSYDLVL